MKAKEIKELRSEIENKFKDKPETHLKWMPGFKLWFLWTIITVTGGCTSYGDEIMCHRIHKIEDVGNYRIITLESAYYFHAFDNYPYEKGMQVCYISPNPKRSLRYIPEGHILSVSN